MIQSQADTLSNCLSAFTPGITPVVLRKGKLTCTAQSTEQQIGHQQNVCFCKLTISLFRHEMVKDRPLQTDSFLVIHQSRFPAKVVFKFPTIHFRKAKLRPRIASFKTSQQLFPLIYDFGPVLHSSIFDAGILLVHKLKTGFVFMQWTSG